MHKYVFPSALLSLCMLLIVFSDACLHAASTALTAWWDRVLPALFPFSVFLSMSDHAGAFAMLEKLSRTLAERLRISPALLPCMLFGMISGYPNGARVCAMRGIPKDAAFCSFCSPVFLIGVVAQGLYGSIAVMLPLLIAHIGSGLLTVLSQYLLHKPQKPVSHKTICRTTDPPVGFFQQLRESLTIMGSVGGCMVLFSVGIAIIEKLHLLSPIAWIMKNAAYTEEVLLAILHGIFEFAGGCVSIAALSMPLRFKITVTAFTVSFGGLCVLMQSAMFLERASMLYYAKIKLFQGILAALIAYLIFPQFCSDAVSVMISADEMMNYAANAFSMGSILLSSGCVLLAFYLFACALERYSKNRPYKEHGPKNGSIST